ncbi:hypothetical protein Cgig2_003094 [Carnegiea gigantea]|uniref:AAA+ ATPase domain-containing protein n=1 Tax=Carnegiea gigantea TaxID=171969 RepID=A0A9Q1GQ79_9CARY|nr:hypothetical protein Cgig2_003094 [Carnegiea gigantea]
MEKPADQTDPVAVVNAIEVESPDRKVVRRRFVQQTLFPLKPHEPKVENSAKKEKTKKVEEVVDDDEEECCGSQGRRSRKKGSNKKEAKRVVDVEIVDELDDEEEYCGSQGRSRKRGKKSKQNSTPQKRGYKKGAANGKDATVIALDDIESPDDGSPQLLKDKKHVSARSGRTQGNKGTSTAKVPTHPAATLQTSQPVPDLWLEAKRTAEENSRLFAGKQVHPFFSAWKTGKKDQVTIEVENNVDRRKERHAECGPIHVFENVQVHTDSIDWSKWTLCEGTLRNSACDQERTISSFKNVVGSLNFGTDLNVSKASPTLLHLEDLSTGQYAHEDTCAIPTSDSFIVVDEEMTPYDLMKNMEKDFGTNKLRFIAGNVDLVSSTSGQQKAILLERIMSYYLSRMKHTENSLWTNKYQPEKALEVCGNSEAVKFINEWLHLWHSTDFRVGRRSSGASKCSVREDDCDSCDSDSDLENVDEEPGLKNVLLVTGPVGSGKSAAIYACAKEQGFQVIELVGIWWDSGRADPFHFVVPYLENSSRSTKVNASDWRNGAVLKQKFGEAVGSHWLKRSQENPVGSPNKHNLKSSPTVITNGSATLDLNKSIVEVVSLSEEEDSADGMQCTGDGRIPCDQREIKTVILFEDVDATLCEDRGFISTIQQLADTGKRPMILTSNSENPMLPDSLAREEVCFTLPSLEELIHHIYLVCAAEKANLQPCLIERCICFCRGDIRKTLMYLQFWCQSKGFLKDGKARMVYSPPLFNLEAGYCTLPKLIPWELPSSLSVFVEAEIASTLCKTSMEEHSTLLEVIEEEVGNTSVENDLDFDNGELASIQAKKAAILRENCFLHVDNDIIAVSNACDLYNSSDSPVAFARRSVPRKLGTVLSDSEDDIPAVSGGLAGGDGNCSAPADEVFPIPCLAVNDTSNVLDDELVHTGAVELKLSSDTAHLSNFNFSPVGNSLRSTDHCVQYTEANFAEIQHQHIKLAGVNSNSMEAANHSLNLLSDQLLRPIEAKLEANSNLFKVISQVHQNSPPIGNVRDKSTDNAIQYAETDAMGTEMGNVHWCRQEAAVYCMNPSSDLSQHREESKMAVKRCLFPQAVHIDPIDCNVDIRPHQSTNQFSGKLNMGELSYQCLAEGITNCSGQVTADCTMDSFIAQFPSHQEANVENIEYKHPEIATTNTFSFIAVDNSLNRSSLQVFYSLEDKALELQNQCPKPGTASHMNCTATAGDSLNQLSIQFLGIEKPEEMQGRSPGSADAKDAVCHLEDWSLKRMSHQSPFEEKNIENRMHQLAETAGIDVISGTVAGNSMNPVTGKFFEFGEEQQSQYSEATKCDHVASGFRSLDMSCVPESTFVPETEVNDGTEFASRDLMEIVSPLTVDTVDPSVLKCETSGHIERCRDIDLNAKNEEMGDSQSENECPEASTSGCQVMDECSRMDFSERSKSFWSSRVAAKNPIQEKWNELRQKDLRQHFISENKNACQVLEVACGMSNLISEADLLLHPSRFPTDDSLDQEICLGEQTSNFGWWDKQVQMACTIAEHGYCLHARSINSLQLEMGMDNKVHLAWELLASTSNSMALGKLLRLDGSSGQNFLADGRLKGAAPTVEISLMRYGQNILTCLSVPIHIIDGSNPIVFLTLVSVIRITMLLPLEIPTLLTVFALGGNYG